MKSVFILWRSHEDPDGSESEKLIGVYESRFTAETARARVATKPGFVEYPDDFIIAEYEIGRDHWTEGYVRMA